jgi:hypothetical protein
MLVQREGKPPEAWLMPWHCFGRVVAGLFCRHDAEQALDRCWLEVNLLQTSFSDFDPLRSPHQSWASSLARM